jgi:integrase
MTGRRRFGSVRKRSSGRWQAEYWHEGRRRSIGTFSTKAEAWAVLSTIEVDLHKGAWLDPRAGQVTLGVFANGWQRQRPELADRTRELYRFVLDRHVLPSLGDVALAGLSPSKIRGWHAGIAKFHPATAAKSYRLLSTIMRTAVNDGLILSSLGKVVGVGVERAEERPVATVAEIEALESAMPEHLRIVVLLAAWCQLRRGEILGLRRRDVDLLHRVVRIEQTRTFTMKGESLIKVPKTTSSRRTIAMPDLLVERLAMHLNRTTDVNPDALIITGRNGSLLSRDALQGSWERARARVGRTDLRFHDLRHAGLTLAAATGATTAELMHRAGHSSAAAALRYQHATRDRDRIVADALEALIKPATITPIKSAMK